MKKKLTTNVRFIWQVKVPVEGWITASSYKMACLISSRIGETVRKDPALRGMNYGGIRERLV